MNALDPVLWRRGILFILLSLSIAVSWNCKPKDPGLPLGNLAPVTRLANIPPPQDTIVTQNPRLTLYWVGDDPDGYVTGYRYRWSFRLNKQAPFQYKSYKYLLNIMVSNFALLVDTQDPSVIPAVYKYFATLPPDGLDKASEHTLSIGDTIMVSGVPVYASNSDSIRIPNRFPAQRQTNPFPVHINPNGGTFIFDSQDTLNLHTFEVAAIDNLGQLSTSPAEVSFETPQVPPPRTTVTGPRDTSFVLDHQTDTFQGIRFDYSAVDPNSRTIDYSWVVDKDQWPEGQIPWSQFDPAQTAYVTAANFPDPYATHHTFYVRARNEFGSIDTLGYYVNVRLDSLNNPIGYDTVYARASFDCIYPRFKRPDISYTQRILLVDIAFNDTTGIVGHLTNDSLESYYSKMFDALGKQGKYDIQRVHADLPESDARGFPSVGQLSNYSMMFMFGDNVDNVQNTHHFITGTREAIISNYCFVGGKWIVGGWNLLDGRNFQQNEPFFDGVPHIIGGSPLLDSVVTGPFKGVQGYPDLSIDTTRLDPRWRNSRTGLAVLVNMRLATPLGFGEYIYTSDYRTPFGMTTGQFAVRYIGVTFDAIWIGFPLYYMQESQSLAALQKAMQDIGEY